MRSQKEQVWYHVDVNSAYLSWTAAYRVCILGEDLDLRDLPSVIGGSEAERHGIVLAKSSSAKGYGIRRCHYKDENHAGRIGCNLL